jgi:hypothetical protein
MDEPPTTAPLDAPAEEAPAILQRSAGRRWGRLLVILLVILAPLGYLISQQSPNLLSHVSALFRPTATPTTMSPQALAMKLRARPLRLPSLPAGSICPVTRSHTVNFNFTVAGDGPVYLFSPEELLLYTPARSTDRQGWGASQITFLVSPGTNNIALIRGHQLDGPSEVGFGKGDPPDTELVVTAPAQAHPEDLSNQWTQAFEIIRLRETGCYAIQIDSEATSSVVIFRAEPQ